jgi:hypothetical protein
MRYHPLQRFSFLYVAVGPNELQPKHRLVPVIGSYVCKCLDRVLEPPLAVA